MGSMPVGKSDQVARLKYWKEEVKRLTSIKFRTPAQESRLAIAVSYALIMEQHLKEVAETTNQPPLL